MWIRRILVGEGNRSLGLFGADAAWCRIRHGVRTFGGRSLGRLGGWRLNGRCLGNSG